jgi:hypothetical protein
MEGEDRLDLRLKQLGESRDPADHAEGGAVELGCLTSPLLEHAMDVVMLPHGLSVRDTS